METKFTPGPWRATTEAPDESGLPYAVIKAGGERRGFVAGGSFSISGVVSAPDAALIAAAPELYVALEGIITCLEGGFQIPRQAAYQALAKARGEA